MLTGYIRGQELRISTPEIAADSIKYLEAEFHFAGRDWDGYVKTAYFINGTSKFALVLADDRITADMGLNLTAGEWEVKLSGVKGGSRITTTTEHVYVREFGSTDGTLPDVTATQAEQILAKIGDLSDLTTEDKTNLVAAINEAAMSGGGSGGGKDGTGIESITYKGEDEDGGNVYTVLLTDGTSYEITAPKGAKGDKGDPGAGLSTAAAEKLVSILRAAVYSSDQSAAISALAAELGVQEVAVWTITNRLTDITTSSMATTIQRGAAYTATLTAAEGYEISTVKVTMGGVDITATAYANGVITIAAVTGDVIITATAAASGGGDELITNGLLAYFDFRNIPAESQNVTVGTAKGLLPTQGNGALFSWAATPITSSDEYGAKLPRGLTYSGSVSTNAYDYGTELTVVELRYGGNGGNGIAGGGGGTPSIIASYKDASGTSHNATTTTRVLSDGYMFKVYRVSGDNLTIVCNDKREEFAGADYDNFASWDNDIKVGFNLYGNGYGTATALYSRALTDVEIEEMRAFMQTLEVSA